MLHDIQVLNHVGVLEARGQARLLPEPSFLLERPGASWNPQRHEFLEPERSAQTRSPRAPRSASLDRKEELVAIDRLALLEGQLLAAQRECSAPGESTRCASWRASSPAENARASLDTSESRPS